MSKNTRTTDEKNKRSLFSSPLSAKKDPKRGRIENEEEDTDGVGCEPLTDALTIHEVVLTKVNEALLTFKSELEGGDGSGGADVSFILKLIPTLATAVSVGVGEVVGAVLGRMEKRMEERVKKLTEPTPAVAALEAAVRRLTYDNDRLQQYTRRESVRVFGISQEQGERAEDVETKVIKVMEAAGVEVKADDLAAVHRAGKAVRGCRPVLVKFVSRRKRRELMQKKKALKEKSEFKDIYINDDLTPLRSRLLGYVKRLDGVKTAWSFDGRIMVQKKYPEGLPQEQRPKPIAVENPDDLFQLGVDRVDYGDLGLTHLVFSGDHGMD